MVTHPLKDGTRARAAIEPGYALTVAYKENMRVTADQCDQQGIAFIPVVAESLGGWHKVGLEQLRKLGSALARHTGQEEGETVSHLLTRASLLLQKGLSAQQVPMSSNTCDWRNPMICALYTQFEVFLNC